MGNYFLLALPFVIGQPHDAIMLINQTLSITCSFNAKPVATVSWIYGVSDEPDTTVLNVTSRETHNKPYTITNSDLSWNTDVEEERKLISGNYTCTAVNPVGVTTSQTAIIDIHCTFSYISLNYQYDKF